MHQLFSFLLLSLIEQNLHYFNATIVLEVFLIFFHSFLLQNKIDNETKRNSSDKTDMIFCLDKNRQCLDTEDVSIKSNKLIFFQDKNLNCFAQHLCIGL